jgi:hypothetical protein
MVTNRAAEDLLKEMDNESLGPGLCGGNIFDYECGLLRNNCHGQSQPSASCNAIHHGSASKSDDDSRPDGYVFCHGGRYRAFVLSMEQEWRRHQWREFIQLHDPGYRKF